MTELEVKLYITRLIQPQGSSRRVFHLNKVGVSLSSKERMSCCGKKSPPPIVDPLKSPLARGIKVIILGAAGCGKSSLMHRVVEGVSVKPAVTMGAAFMNLKVNMEGTDIQLEFWDTAGQERFLAVTRSYLRDTVVALLVYDITSMDSFHAVQFWLSQLNDTGGAKVLMVLGNKLDCEPSREVEAVAAATTTRSTLTKCLNLPTAEFLECSAVTGANTATIVPFICKKLIALQKTTTSF
ncbi:Rab family GTPase [Pelomyxa schiedti]|nr:Rab family GTPase [Pelomyxa schiedti]